MTPLWFIYRSQTQLEPEGTQNATERCLGWIVARMDSSQGKKEIAAILIKSLC